MANTNKSDFNVELDEQDCEDCDGCGCSPDVEHGLCNPDCPNLVIWEHPFWHNTAWCWYMMKDLSWYDYWIADCIDGKPDKQIVKIKECGRTEPPNAKKPRGKWVTALYYTVQTKDVRTIHGLVMCKGNLNDQWETYKAYEHLLLIHGVKESDVHAIGWESSRIKV